jgi:uncharacterized membrane protein YgcG
VHLVGVAHEEVGDFMTRRATIDRNRVREAVETADRRTSAAIVVSIAPFFVGNVERAAHRVFTRLGVAHPSRRGGVLVFVVPARQVVVVLCDEGARRCIDGSLWHEVASQIAEAFARGEGTIGLVEGVDRLAHALSISFPHEGGDVAERLDPPRLGSSTAGSRDEPIRGP